MKHTLRILALLLAAICAAGLCSCNLTDGNQSPLPVGVDSGATVPGGKSSQTPSGGESTPTPSGGNTTTVRFWNIDANGNRTAYQTVEYPTGEKIEPLLYGEGWMIYKDENGDDPADEDGGVTVTGIELNFYRKDKDNVDYVGVTYVRYFIDRFGKAGYFDRTTAVHRKGALVDVYSDAASYFGGEELSVYADKDRTQRLSEERAYCFTENVTLYACCKNNGYTSYDILSEGGGVILTQALNYVSLGTENEEYHSEDRNIRGTVTETSLSENARSFHVKDVQYSKKYTICYCYNGHVVTSETWYFEGKFAWAVNQNSLFYTDPGLTTHPAYTGNEEGVIYFTDDTTLYLPFDASGGYN